MCGRLTVGRFGGVSGDNSGFIRISELRAYGQSGGIIQSNVTAPTMSVAKGSGDTLVISWPTAAANFVLKSTASLSPPAWSVVTDPTVIVGANFTVTVASTNGTRFYRLEQ